MSLVKSQLQRQTVCCHFDGGDMVGRTGDASPVSPRWLRPWSLTLTLLNMAFLKHYCYCVKVSSVTSRQYLREICWRTDAGSPKKQEWYLVSDGWQSIHCTRPELSDGGLPTVVADSDNVCQIFTCLLVFLPDAAHLRTFHFALYKCTLLMTITTLESVKRFFTTKNLRMRR